MDKHLAKRTMVGKKGSRFIQDILKIIFNENIQGDLIQCGVWRGGIAGLMLDYILKSEIDSIRSTKKLWLYDTFEGMPPPGGKDPQKAKDYYVQTKNTDNEFSDWCKASIEDVIETLKYVSEDYDYYTKLVQGKVEETLLDDKNLPTKIALLHLDTDWYSSTKIELEILYPLIVDNGFLIVDDYQKVLGSKHGWEGCTQAVNEYFKHQPTPLEHFEHDKILILQKRNIL